MSGEDVTASALNRAIALHQAGQLEQAEAIYNDLVRREPKAWQAFYFLGLILAGRNRFAAAADHFEQATRINPQFLEGYFNRGVVLTAVNRLGDALESYRRALSIRADYLDAYYNGADVLMKLRRFPEALDFYDRLLGCNPAHAGALNNRGNLLRELGRLDEAMASYDRALQFNPDHAEAWTNRGVALASLLRFEEAIKCHDRALAIDSKHAGAYHNRGCAFLGLERFDLALKDYDSAIAINAGNPEFWRGRGSVLAHLNRFDEAVQSCERAIALDPGEPHSLIAYGTVLGAHNAGDRAVACFERALTIDPNNAEARIASCMLELPILYSQVRDIEARRKAYGDKLKALCRDVENGCLKGNLVKAASIAQPFYLAYQAQNDRDLQRLYGSLLCEIMGRHLPEAALPPPPGQGEPVRVGFVSAFFRNHSVWKAPLKGWVSALDRRRFKLFGYHVGNVSDATTQSAAGLFDRFVDRRQPLDAWREEILADAPHVLIYPGLLMDDVSVKLAALRLAPVQCNSWGHPETSGFATIDYFLSSDLMEPPDAETHYTERLVRLPNLSIDYEPVEVDQVAISRTELGLRPDATVFWSGQSLYKYLPQFDHVFARIGKEVTNCQFVFIRHPRSGAVTAQCQDRLDRAFAACGIKAADHCVWLKQLSQQKFIAAIGQCDIALDTPEWSGCNSTFEGLTHDLPIVTLPGSLMRGRHTAAMLRMMGIEETIATSIDDYIAIAVRLANEPEFRHRLAVQIAANKHRLYRDRACIVALEDFLDRAARGGAAFAGTGAG
jgi:protein O-GlcNAc transferase